MGYTGQVYRLPFDRGGLNHNPNADQIQPEMMIHPSRNINLHEGGRGKRGGTSVVYSAPFSGSPRVVGIYNFRLTNGIEFLIAATGDGNIYKDGTTTIKTGLGPNKITSFETYKDKLYICNGYDIPQVWDGVSASTSDTSPVPVDWTGTNYPKQIIKHGRGVSERGWAIGCPDTPYTVYASENGTFNFDPSTVVTIDINTNDGFGIVGAVEFGDRLFCFGKTQTFIIDDTDTNIANWGYVKAQWEGGVAHHRLIVKTPNDVVCMTEDGDIYSVTAVQAYGDYKRASIARPAFIDRWIREHVNLSKIDDFHAIYDPTLRAIKFFVVRAGMTEVDTALVYFIDRPPAEAWVIHDNQDNPSGYSASCSTLYRESTGKYKVYTGDYSGNIWKLEEVNKNDNGKAYYAGFKTSHLTFDNPRVKKKYKRGYLVTHPEGSHNIYIRIWVDGVEKGTKTVVLAGAGGILGSFALGTSTLGGHGVVDNRYELGYVGKRIQKEFYNSNADEDFFISQDLTDFKPLGIKP